MKLPTNSGGYFPPTLVYAKQPQFDVGVEMAGEFSAVDGPNPGRLHTRGAISVSRRQGILLLEFVGGRKALHIFNVLQSLARREIRASFTYYIIKKTV